MPRHTAGQTCQTAKCDRKHAGAGHTQFEHVSTSRWTGMWRLSYTISILACMQIDANHGAPRPPNHTCTPNDTLESSPNKPIFSFMHPRPRSRHTKPFEPCPNLLLRQPDIRAAGPPPREPRPLASRASRSYTAIDIPPCTDWEDAIHTNAKHDGLSLRNLPRKPIGARPLPSVKESCERCYTQRLRVAPGHAALRRSGCTGQARILRPAYSNISFPAASQLR
jgi:hypothetical protein